MTYQELINQILQLEEEGLEIFNVGKSPTLLLQVGEFDLLILDMS